MYDFKLGGADGEIVEDREMTRQAIQIAVSIPTGRFPFWRSWWGSDHHAYWGAPFGNEQAICDVLARLVEDCVEKLNDVESATVQCIKVPIAANKKSYHAHITCTGNGGALYDYDIGLGGEQNG